MPELSDVKIKITTDADNKGVDEAEKRFLGFSDKAVDASKKLTLAIGGIALGVAAFGMSTLKDYEAQEDALSRLQTGINNVKSATDKSITSLTDYAGSLQKTTRFADEEIESGMAMLTTFQLNQGTIKSLTPGMLDMAEAFRKSTGETISLEQVSVLFGKVMGGASDGIEGMASSLKKMGVIMTEEQKAVFKFGTEQERAATLANVMDLNFKGFAEGGAKTTAGKMAILNNQIGEVKEAFGKLTAEAITPLITKLTPLAETLANNIGPAMQKLTEFVQNNQGVLIGLGIIIGTIIVPALLSWAATAALAAISTVIALGPISLIIIGITALVTALYLAWNNNFLGIRDIVGSVVAWITTAFGNFVLFIQGVWAGVQAIIDGFVAWFQNTLIPIFTTVFDIYMLPYKILWDLVVIVFAAISSIMTAFINWIGTTFGPSFNTAMTFIKNILTGVQTFFTTIWAAITALLKTFGDWLNKTFTPIIDAAFTWIKTALTNLKNFWDGIWNGLHDIVSGIANKIIGTVKGLVNTVIDFFNGIINGANSVGSKVPGYIKLPTIPRFASGVSNFGGGWAWVGENGPELLNLPRGSNVVPANQVEKATAPTIQVTQNIFGDVDMEMALRQLAYAVERA